MTTLAEFMKARIREDMASCDLEIQLSDGVPRMGWPTCPERVQEMLRVQLVLVEAYESCAASPRVHEDQILYTQMATLRGVVGDFARAYAKHPDYLTW